MPNSQVSIGLVFFVAALGTAAFLAGQQQGNDYLCGLGGFLNGIALMLLVVVVRPTAKDGE